MAPVSSAEFVAAMEDVLEVYSRPPDAARPLVCLDECTKQLTREVRTPQPAAPGRAAREDNEYARNGVAAIFCVVAPHLGWRRIEERERKTRGDYAHILKALADEHFPKAERIVLVQDNLNTRTARHRSTKCLHLRKRRGTESGSSFISRPNTGAG